MVQRTEIRIIRSLMEISHVVVKVAPAERVLREPLSQAATGQRSKNRLKNRAKDI
jgi:hypothetical protein